MVWRSRAARPAIAFAQAQTGALDGVGAETATGGEIQRLQVRVEQQDGGGVGPELGVDLFQHDVQGDAQFQAGGDGDIDVAQRLHIAQAALGLVEQARIGDGHAHPVGQLIQEAGIFVGEIGFCATTGDHQGAKDMMF